MSDATIYQRIFDVDIAKSSGLQALLPHETRDPSVGYVVVTESLPSSSNNKLLASVYIPPSKQKSYALAKNLFDNYNIRGNEVDDLTPSELLETDDLISFVSTTPPMDLARKWIDSRRANYSPISDSEWVQRIKDTWFRTFRSGSGGPTRSGFEHVFLGEWNTKRDKVGGFHWWYYYYTHEDDIRYTGAKYGSRDAASGISVPEIATMGFDWEVDDGTTIGKKIGGFHVGCSVEGLMAMGMVRAAFDCEPQPPRLANISGMNVEIVMFNSQDSYKSINTMYPIVKSVIAGSLPPPPTSSPTVIVPEPNTATYPETETNGNGASREEWFRIISILANPEGHDIGRENVTIANMYGPDDASAKGWQVHGPNRGGLRFGELRLARGEVVTITVRKNDSLQLTNKGGEVKLVNKQGRTVQRARYTRQDGREQGGVLLWDGMGGLGLIKQ